MDRVWTPWRFQYLKSTPQEPDCIFCHLHAQKNDRENLVLTREHHNFIVLNRFPYTNGHMLIVTHRHVGSLAEARPEELAEMILLSRRCESILAAVYQPNGYNIGFNIGKSAGAGVAGHLHLHVVPRWEGDANFVSVVGETRVIPENLETTYDKLAAHFTVETTTNNHPKR